MNSKAYDLQDLKLSFNSDVVSSILRDYSEHANEKRVTPTPDAAVFVITRLREVTTFRVYNHLPKLTMITWSWRAQKEKQR